MSNGGLSLKLKLTIIVFTLGTIFLGCLTVQTSGYLQDSLEVNSLKYSSQKAKREALGFQESFQKIKQDLSLLVDSLVLNDKDKPFRGSVDIDQNSHSSFIPKAKAEEFFSFVLNHNTSYSELSLTKNTGKEVARVVRDRSKPKPINSDELQNKIHSDFYRRASVLSQGELLISDVFVKRELSQVIVPLTPMLKIAAPIYKLNQGLVGLVTVNVELNKLLPKAQATIEEPYLFIVNEQGDYVYHPDEKKIMTIEVGKKLTVQQEYSLPWNHVIQRALHSKSESVFSEYLPKQNVTLSLHQLNLDKNKTDGILMIGVVDSFSSTSFELQQYQRKIGILLPIVWIALCFFVYVTIKKAMKRVKVLNYEIDQIVQGLELEISALGNDEISSLTLSIQNLLRKYSKSSSILQEENITLKESLTHEKAISQSRNRMLAHISHEIRTPLNGILGLTELVLLTNLDDKQTKDLKTVLASGNTLRKILNDLLDYLKAASDQLELDLREFDLGCLIEQVYQLFLNQVDASRVDLNIEIEYASNTLLIGDVDRLRQVLMNLVSNAIKFTEEGEVLVKISVLNESKDSVDLRFLIKDTGIGIREGDQSKLFSEFTQVDSTIFSKYGGTGLGLAISKDLVRLMSGEITLVSKEGAGSSFSFDLHFNKSENPPNTIEMQNLSSAFGKVDTDNCILIVEDDVVNQRVILGMLGQIGLKKIDIASSGKEALELFEEGKYNLIFMDIHLSDMSGFDIAKQIREQENIHNAVIVALTADALNEKDTKCIEVGMTNFLTKPIESKKLLSLVDGLLNYGEKAYLHKSAEESQFSQDNSSTILITFLKDFPTRLQKLESLMIENNTSELIHSLQNLRGIGINLGLDELVDYVKSLENIVSMKTPLNHMLIVEELQIIIEHISKKS